MMTFHLRYGKPLAASLILLGAFTVSVGGGNMALAQTKASSQTSDVALEGYCPVCIVEAKKWVRGNPRHQVTHDSSTYYFPSDKEKRGLVSSTSDILSPQQVTRAFHLLNEPQVKSQLHFSSPKLQLKVTSRKEMHDEQAVSTGCRS